jgi:hypothetical protein
MRSRLFTSSLFSSKQLASQKLMLVTIDTVTSLLLTIVET